MIIVPNNHSKQRLQERFPNTPILLLADYMQTLLLQTPFSIASNGYLQHLLLTLVELEKIPDMLQHINHLLQHNIDLIALQKHPHPNTKWVGTVTTNFLEKLAQQHYLHPQSVYTQLSQQPINLLYDKVQHYGFYHLPDNLQLFFQHHGITELNLENTKTEHQLYTFTTPSEEVEQALKWLETTAGQLIVMDNQYQALLNRYLSTQQAPNYLKLIQSISKPEPILPKSFIPHLYRTKQYPKELPLLKLLSQQTFSQTADIELSPILQSTHTPKQTSLSFHAFKQIIDDICALWRLAPPNLAQLQSINDKMSYEKWHQRFMLLESNPNNTLTPLSIQGGYFDHIWLLGAQDTSWQTRTTLHWLPPEHQRQTSFAFLTKSAKQIVHSCQKLGTNGEHHQFFIDKPLDTPPVHNPPPIALEHFNNWQTASTEKVSSSILKDYANCPFIAFSNHRLKLQPKKDLSLAMEPQHYGTIAHDALELLYTPIKQQAALLNITQDKITNSVHTAWKKHQPNLHENIATLLQQKMITSISTWIEKDTKRPFFSIQQLETKRELSIGPYTLKLRLDRIDKEADKSVLIDYKTANIGLNEALSPLFSSPQMALYALTEPHPAIIAYANITPQARWQSIDLETNNYDELKQFWKNTILKHLDAYTKGLYPAKPVREERCNLCQLQSLCRYYDHGVYSNETH